MTREIGDIIAAFKEAQRAGRQTALATVVHVEGSSYRRPGARMLVEDNGRITGAISGGCLEGDALRKALLAIQQGRNKLVTYDTLNDDDAHFGIQLGCNGIVHILFEPIVAGSPDNPLAILEKVMARRRAVVIGTLFSLRDYQENQPGTCIFFDGNYVNSKRGNSDFESRIEADISIALQNKSSLLKEYENDLSVFFEVLEPPVLLIVIGAGNDAFPLVEMAGILGWDVTVLDGRSSHANAQRFAAPRKVIVTKPGEILERVPVDEKTFFVIMTHNYNYDMDVIPLLLQTSCPYIGVLGPRKRLNKLIDELDEKGFTTTADQLSRIYGPIGLDIGAETAEEIALSVLAEIKAVIAGRTGSSLRTRLQPIHSR